jgi:putative FmdB family regulatory protein
MAIYEYFCPKCKAEFELMRPISKADEPASCPKCGSQGEKLVSVFASKADFYLKVPEKGAFRKPDEQSNA